MSLEAPDGTSFGPTARLRSSGRYTYFFLDVAAGEDLDLTVSHPEVRTIVEPIESLGGSARALTGLRLRSRPDLAFEIDYRPARDHEVQQIEVAHCGRSQRIPSDLATCHWRDPPLELRPGAHQYRIEDLDTGRYVTRARIDDEIVSGLGHGFRPYLAPDADEPTAPVGPMLLEEMEIFGHILDGDEPVRGEVVLVSGADDVPKRRFPTDEDLLYHLYYFGREPWAQLIRDEDRDRPPEELLGLYYHYTLGACDDRYYCRFFNLHSTLRGEGRLDLPLGEGRRLQETVVDAETGVPIEAASVAVPANRWTLRFVDGDVERGEPFGVEPTVTLTNANGLARVRLPEDREDWVTVHKEGFEQKTVSVQVASSGPTRMRVRLTPDSESVGAEIRLANGKPLDEAALLAFGRGGGRDPVCHGTTNRYGRIELPERCREGRLFVVVHPEAAMALLRSDVLTASGRPVLVDPAPRQPLTAQLVDASGQPLVDVPIEIGLGPIRLDANDLLAAVTKSGYLPFYRTDGKGELVLRGLDPGSAPTPVLISPLGPRGGTVSLAGHEPGDTVRLRVTGAE